jgi:hypothetical protein
MMSLRLEKAEFISKERSENLNEERLNSGLSSYRQIPYVQAGSTMELLKLE